MATLEKGCTASGGSTAYTHSTLDAVGHHQDIKPRVGACSGALRSGVSATELPTG
jgi:hypothetical protein